MFLENWRAAEYIILRGRQDGHKKKKIDSTRRNRTLSPTWKRILGFFFFSFNIANLIYLISTHDEYRNCTTCVLYWVFFSLSTYEWNKIIFYFIIIIIPSTVPYYVINVLLQFRNTYGYHTRPRVAQHFVLITMFN